MTQLPTDPMERRFAELCKLRNIDAVPHDHISGLDFFLPDYELYVELKQFHSDRIAKQMARRKNVIAIQGASALEAFGRLLGVVGSAAISLGCS